MSIVKGKMHASKDLLVLLSQLLRECESDWERVAILCDFFEQQGHKPFIVPQQNLQAQVIALSLAAIGQEIFEKDFPVLQKLQTHLQPIGGLVGYQATVLQLLDKGSSSQQEIRPPVIKKVPLTVKSVDHLASVGMVIVAGGLATRLNFKDQAGAPLPAALFQYRHQKLIDYLINDLEALEALYFQKHGECITIPIALLGTETLFEDLKKRLEPRRVEAMFCFKQPSLPCIDEMGDWVYENEELVVQPGGHGAIWHLMEQHKVFEWFEKRKISSILMRQINNPAASKNATLLSFLQTGIDQHQVFGILGCPRDPEAAEGMLVSKMQDNQSYLSNIEYTQIATQSLKSDFPANTNILFASVPKIRPYVKKTPFLDPFLNLKQTKGDKKIGRVETLMQNISEKIPEKERVFVQTFPREEALGAVKTQHMNSKESVQAALEQEEYAAKQLLALCKVQQQENTFWYHPALGPLYTLIAQKMQQGMFCKDVFLEISRWYSRHVTIKQGLELKGLLGAAVFENVIFENPCQVILHKNAEFYAFNTHLTEKKYEVAAGKVLIIEKDQVVEFSTPINWQYRIKAGFMLDVAIKKDLYPVAKMTPFSWKKSLEEVNQALIAN